MKTHSKLITNAQQILLDLKFYHWNSKIYAEHIALDDAYEALAAITDTIAESLIGREGPLEPALFSSPSCNLKDLCSDIFTFAKALKTFAESKEYCDLENLSDEINAKGARLQYLLELA